MRKTITLLLGLLSTGCITQQATLGAIPKERATECVEHCAALDMKLSAVVIIRSSAGCVCEPKDAEAGKPASSVAAAAGGAIIADDEARQQQQQQQQQQFGRPF